MKFLNKRIFYFILIIIILFSCKKKEEKINFISENEEEKTINKEEETIIPVLEKHRNDIEEYCGYYFSVYKDYHLEIDELIIIKISLDDHLYLQDFIFENDELIEVNRIDYFIGNIDGFYGRLNFVDINNPKHGDDYIRYSYLKPYWNNARLYISYEKSSWTSYKNPKSVIFSFKLENSVFTKDSKDVKNTIDRYFSSKAKEKYTGKYVFQHHEFENDGEFYEDKHTRIKEINVILLENGYLEATYDEDNERQSDKFYIYDHKIYIYGYNRMDYADKYYAKYIYYEDENTIILESYIYEDPFNVEETTEDKEKWIFKKEKTEMNEE